MIEIDGSAGEGGGQMIRSSLTLSVATGQPFRITQIRSRRSRPGLLHQHLAAVNAAAAIGDAKLTGASLHSRELTFEPRTVRPGEYRFAVGTAGSATLVLQTVLPILLTADGPSTLRLEGGTHNPLAPPFECIEHSYLPVLRGLGARVNASLERRGFFPAGGGKVQVNVQPVDRLAPLELLDRGKIRSVLATAVVANLPRHIAEREVNVLAQKLSRAKPQTAIVEDEQSAGPGNVVLVQVDSEHVTEVFAAFGRRGLPAETVAERAGDEAADYLASRVAVGTHLADQLLVPLALGSGGRYTTFAPSGHTTTNIDVIRKFVDIDVRVTEEADRTVIDVRR